VPYRDHGSREKYGQHHPTPGQREAFRGQIDRSPRTSGLQGAGREPGTADRNENRGNENRGNENRGNEHRGYEDRSHAFSGADRARQVNHEAARGHSYDNRGHSAAHGGSYHGGWHGGGRGGGGHGGGGHGGRR